MMRVKTTMERINAAASRMQDLIEDLVNLTSLSKSENVKESVNLNKTLKYVLNDLETRSKRKTPLSRVVNSRGQGISGATTDPFQRILDNALKFSRQGVKPVIAITSELTNGYELTHLSTAFLTRNSTGSAFPTTALGRQQIHRKNVSHLSTSAQPGV